MKNRIRLNFKVLFSYQQWNAKETDTTREELRNEKGWEMRRK